MKLLLTFLAVLPVILSTQVLKEEDILIAPESDGESNNADIVPSFKWDSSQKSEAGLPFLVVEFNDGGPDDAVMLKPSEISSDLDDCILEGHFEYEHEIFVSLNGCPMEMTFDIVFNSERLPHFMFHVEDGVVTPVDPSNGKDNDGKRDAENQFGDVENENITITSDDVDISLGQMEDEDDSDNKRALPSGGFELKLSMNYDNTWASRYGSGSVNKMRQIVNLAQTIFRFSSLTSPIKLRIVQEQRVSSTVRAESSINTVMAYSDRNSVNANAYSYMAYDGGRTGTIGRAAAFHGVCNSRKGLRSQITEWFRNDLDTAETLAHEIGHLLYMKHDFGTQGGRRAYIRKDSRGRSCTSIYSVMDYSQRITNKWSTCSVEDFTYYYNAIKGQTGGFCLTQIGGGGSGSTCRDTGRYCNYVRYYGCGHGYFRAYCRKTCRLC